MVRGIGATAYGGKGSKGSCLSHSLPRLSPFLSIKMQVLVITTGPDAPSEYCGAKVVQAPTFRFALYNSLPLSLGYSRKVWRALKEFDPDIIHASSPGQLGLKCSVGTLLGLGMQGHPRRLCVGELLVCKWVGQLKPLRAPNDQPAPPPRPRTY